MVLLLTDLMTWVVIQGDTCHTATMAECIPQAHIAFTYSSTMESSLKLPKEEGEEMITLLMLVGRFKRNFLHDNAYTYDTVYTEKYRTC